MADKKRSAFRAQHGEDEILSREFAGQSTGHFVEVGSYNGESYSNTYYLEHTLGWNGVLIEADPMLHQQGEKIRPRSICINCAVSAPDSPAKVTFEVVEGCRWVSSLSVSASMLKRIEDVPTQIRKVTVDARTLDSILADAKSPESFDLLSIDVEGHEWPVLQGFSIGRWNPKIVILERNDHLADRRIIDYMHANGYGWLRTTGCNDWFYAGAALKPGYRLRLFTRFYLPKYLSFYKPFLHGPARRFAKRVLRKVGILEGARGMLGKRRKCDTPSMGNKLNVG